MDEKDAHGFEEIENIDQFDHDDPQCCTEYVESIFEYLKKKEVILLIQTMTLFDIIFR